MSDVTRSMAVGLGASAALVILLAARVHVGAAPSVAEPRREVLECGNGAVERLLDAVEDNKANEHALGRRLATTLDHCRRWWFDPHWAYSPCRLPGYDAMERRLIDHIFSWQTGQPVHEVPPSLEYAVLSEVLDGCEQIRRR